MGNNPNNPYDLNIHGFPATKPITISTPNGPRSATYNEWTDYAKKRIDEIVSVNSNKTRMTISEFLQHDQFLESKINTIEETNSFEKKRVIDKFKDPLPPLFIERGRNTNSAELIDDGLRRSKDYLYRKTKRREWGFREKLLQGYPEYKPFFSYETRYITGIVTAGSGVFSGIPPMSNIKYTQTEMYRSAEMGIFGPIETPMTPTGLCFIQDETGGLGIALGSDIRYIFHPVIHRSNYSNPYITYDDMHAGSIVIPKADYRQFLRIGDLVVIEVGTNFKYWHAILGSEPRYWEELWIPSNMVVKKRFRGDKPSDVEYYIDDVSYNATGTVSAPSRYPGKNRKPYVDNWGAYERPSQNLEFLNKSQRGRDVPPKGIWGNTYANYPIQEDHPWTTGTPIPVNTGMPYIMMERFKVDETERFSPTPLVITNSQLRGFPNPKHWSSIIKGFDTPKKIGLINPNLAWYKETAENPAFNPWIWNPKTRPDDQRGSDFKGMLVQLKNVRFVLPPTKKQLRARMAPLDIISTPTDEINLKGFLLTPRRLEIAILVLNPRTPESLFNVISNVFGHTGTKQEIQSYISTDILNIKSDNDRRILDSFSAIAKWIMANTIPNGEQVPAGFIFRLIESGQDYVGMTNIGNSTIKKLTDDLNSVYEKLKQNIPIGEIEVLVGNNKLLNAGSIGELELLNFYKNKIDSRGFYFNYANNVISEWLERGDDVGEIILDIGLQILFGVVDSFTFPGFSSTVYTIIENAIDVENWDDEEDGDINSYIQYEFVELESPFPKSVDMEDGGYWWANPDIPLTNARSHWKDTKENNSTGPLTIGFSPADRTAWTQRVSSNKPEMKNLIKERFVKDLGMTYSSSYSPFAEEWKPSTIINGNLVMNEFKPIPPDSYFVGNRTYYVVDEDNVVVPIRINSNTEIARFEVPIPTEPVDITGIAWQYSLGKPGLEWEREAYMMQIWPRFASDITKKQLRKGPDKPDNDGRKPDPPFPPPPPPPPPPTRLPDLTLDIGDNNPSRLDCEFLRGYLDSLNKTKQNYIDGQNWPIIETIGEINIHQDPISGMKIGISIDPVKAKEFIDGMPDYPCKGMTIGQEQELIITSNSGVSKRFHFRVGPNGECICTAYQPGTRNDSSNNNLTNNLGSNVNENIGNRNLNNRIIL